MEIRKGRRKEIRGKKKMMNNKRKEKTEAKVSFGSEINVIMKEG